MRKKYPLEVSEVVKALLGEAGASGRSISAPLENFGQRGNRT
jgi:hypothetical protein